MYLSDNIAHRQTSPFTLTSLLSTTASTLQLKKVSQEWKLWCGNPWSKYGDKSHETTHQTSSLELTDVPRLTSCDTFQSHFTWEELSFSKKTRRSAQHENKLPPVCNSIQLRPRWRRSSSKSSCQRASAPSTSEPLEEEQGTQCSCNLPSKQLGSSSAQEKEESDPLCNRQWKHGQASAGTSQLTNPTWVLSKAAAVSWNLTDSKQTQPYNCTRAARVSHCSFVLQSESSSSQQKHQKAHSATAPCPAPGNEGGKGDSEPLRLCFSNNSGPGVLAHTEMHR